MIKFKLDNTEYEAPEGTTILDAAKSAGFSIPTLCHKDGIPHYSSCMACMVKDNKSNKYLPSCSSLVQDNMDIDVSGEGVFRLRKKAIELLLTEHRAECEAPCKVVCPAGYNIPLMNRLLSARDYDGVTALTVSEIESGEIRCIECPGYCENACRRKKIDISVSIRNMKLFISQKMGKAVTVLQKNDINREKKQTKPFSSRIGRIEPEEQQEWLKECVGDIKRFREIDDFESAASESGSCMHCDCRALNDCRLRDLAEVFSIKDPRGKITYSPIVKKINHKTGLIFENAKCIKCGLCVRLCEDSTDEPALCFLNRGFISIISEPITEDFSNILKDKSNSVIEICPTGALSRFK